MKCSTARTDSPAPFAATRTPSAVVGAIPSSARMLRIAVTASISCPMRASASASRSASAAFGYGATMIDAAGRCIGSACQISSVTNGMNGCSSRIV